MEKYIYRSNSIPSLRSKRPGDAELEWKTPKRTAPSAQMKSNQPITTFNKYGDLPSDQSSVNPQLREASSTRKKSSKIPPIHIQINADWTHEYIKTLVCRYTNGYHFKYLGKNKIAVCCYSTDGHTALQEGLRSENVSFYTYSRKDERTYKYLIFGLPAYVEDQLSNELSSLGFKNATIRKLQNSSKDTSLCPAFLVQLPPGTDITAFQKIKYISSCAIQIRKFKAKTHLGTQCYRCQSFGHSSKHCNLPPRCVKCTDQHATSECPKKDRETPAQCCNCNEHHPANYRHCKERQSYLKAMEVKKEELKLIQSAKRLPRGAALDGRTWAAVTASQEHRTQISGTEVPLRTSAPVGHSDNTTAEMLKILSTIKSLKHEFLSCHTMLDKVVLILTHLGHYV